jgi:endonuclease YncB( thermonuclease family)
VDEPFAWESREFLRKLCIGKEVTFRVDYTAPNVGREFGTVYLGDKNVAYSVIAAGWARVMTIYFFSSFFILLNVLLVVNLICLIR